MAPKGDNIQETAQERAVLRQERMRGKAALRQIRARLQEKQLPARQMKPMQKKVKALQRQRTTQQEAAEAAAGKRRKATIIP